MPPRLKAAPGVPRRLAWTPRFAVAVLLILLAALIGCRRRQPFGAEVLTNRGFEAGSLAPGWESETGACEVVHGPSFAAADPVAGEYFLYGGSSGGGDCRIVQDVDLLARNFDATRIDRGEVGAAAKAWLRSAHAAGSFDDQAFLRVHYLDAQGQELGSLRTLLAGEDAWVERSGSGLVPPGTRIARAVVEARHRLGAANDGMADEASLVMTVGVDEADEIEITKQPFLQDVRQDAMTVLWETDSNLASHVVEYGPLGSGLSEELTRVGTTQLSPDHFVHKAVIEGLAPETEYSYRVRSGGTTSPTHSFRTAPLAGSPIRIAWFADNQNKPKILSQHVPRIAAAAPDLVIAPGDIVQNGEDLRKWGTEWFDPLEISSLAQTTPVLFARGNHDHEHAYSYAYSALPGNESWYSFSYGNTFFVVLDTEAPTRSSLPGLDQVTFLAQALDSAEAQAAEFRIVVFHKPPYTNLWDSSNVDRCTKGHPYDGQEDVRNDWVPLFEEKGVDLVVSGHTHSYQHGVQNGVHYLLVGGGGGALDTFRGCAGSTFWNFIDTESSVFHYSIMDTNGPLLTWTTYDLSNQVIHTFQVSHRP